MKLVKRGLLGLLGFLLIFLAGFAIYVASRQNLRFERPLPAFRASSDPAVVARGEYLVEGAANCAYCHGDPSRLSDVLRGDETVPLSGGHTWNIPPGRFRAYNITSDPETGIGGLSDGQIARALRYGVGREGRALLPFMEMQGLADDDLVAVISYLRTLPPTRHAVPAHEYSLLGRVVKATLLADPVGPATTPPSKAPRGATLENGAYLVEKVAHCAACHTERNMKTGKLVGPRLGGGTVEDLFEPEHRAWHAPNLTSDKTGRTGQLSEDQFVARMKAGRVLEHSPMPWNNFQRLSEDDLRAIYMYIRTVPKVSRAAEPPMTEM